jgi:hypothetical protein
MMEQYDRWRHYDRSIDSPEWLGKQLWPKILPLDRWDYAITDVIALIKDFQPIGRNHYDVVYLSRRTLHR